MVETPFRVMKQTAGKGVALPDSHLVFRPVAPSPECQQFPMRVEAALSRYLTEDIFPQISPPPYGEIEVQNLSDRKPVYLFREQTKNVAVVGKLFKYGAIPLEEAWLRAEKECFNLRLLRERLGMGTAPCRVVAPLGTNRELFAMLVTHKAPGTVLDHYVGKAAHEQQSEQLFDRLSCLAMFFAKLHLNGRAGRPISPILAQRYMSKLLDFLVQGLIGASERNVIERYAARWWDRNDVFAADREVIVHGDATPTNFFLEGPEVTGIDLEKMKRTDRCWDLGFLVAELKHHFMWRSGDRWAAEPFIGHFLWQYAEACGGSHLYDAITRRLPVYMALGLLRIARNAWLDVPYRKDLVSEARRCLKYGL